MSLKSGPGDGDVDSDIPCMMQPCHNLRLPLGPGQINFVTESAQQALTDLLNPNYCL